MALVTECPKCGQNKVTDTHCGYCYECLDKYPELGGHKPTCRVAIKRAKEKAQVIIRLHNLIIEQIDHRNQANKNINSLEYALSDLNPCTICGGNGCTSCGNTGYGPVTDELRRIAEAPDPPKTC